MDIFGISGAMLLEDILYFVSEHVVVVTCTVTAVLVGLLFYSLCTRKPKEPKGQGGEMIGFNKPTILFRYVKLYLSFNVASQGAPSYEESQLSKHSIHSVGHIKGGGRACFPFGENLHGLYTNIALFFHSLTVHMQPLLVTTVKSMYPDCPLDE